MAVVKARKRDYSLIPSYTTDIPLDDDTIEEKVEQTWWSPDIPRQELKALMQRSDRYGLMDFGLWIGLLVVSGTLAWMSWGTGWAIPAFFVFGTIYSSSDARWHECGHGTVFRTRWLNEVFYHISSFMTIREAYLWRWSHARHHTNTIIVGYDPEIQVQRPADLFRILIDFFFLRSGPIEIWRVIKHAAGRPDAGVRSFVPASEIPKMVWSSRIYLMIVAAFAVWSVAIGSFLPMM
ncbi:MAG: fatty acid desaturase, partial [Anaerolineae bacterium]|nr:fatty acid desaturase [Anaerolineae bacterium]